ncbi:hypothetical protein HB780_00690 (plasmid) [Rhizobium lusitanum]|uniref:hypothetical protein n=1 Tax=Rhizobium lusitanum TaxID=293958 RepID=UPI001619738B|nr:hypothetical protein [Rhizobium lusitanum]QND44365.1 hypothetical protein HB780_00690 [Rhizobium lusitanum]
MKKTPGTATNTTSNRFNAASADTGCAGSRLSANASPIYIASMIAASGITPKKISRTVCQGRSDLVHAPKRFADE